MLTLNSYSNSSQIWKKLDMYITFPNCVDEFGSEFSMADGGWVLLFSLEGWTLWLPYFPNANFSCEDICKLWTEGDDSIFPAPTEVLCPPIWTGLPEEFTEVDVPMESSKWKGLTARPPETFEAP